jgi:hypothetical protein
MTLPATISSVIPLSNESSVPLREPSKLDQFGLGRLKSEAELS